MLGLDPASPEFVRDPYPVFARLRAEEPVAWDEERRFWALTRYDDVLAALRDDEVFSSRITSSGGLDPIIDRPSPMISDDPPDHTRLRRLVQDAFAPRRVAGWEPRIRRLVVELLDAMEPALASGAEVDFVSSFASPLPVAVIAEILGVPLSRRRLDDWAFSTALSAEESHDPEVRRRLRADLLETLRELARERRREPADDLLTHLVRASDQEGRLTEDEVVGLSFLLWNAAIEAPTFLFGSGMAALERHPGAKRRILDDPGLLPSFVEEVARYDAPVQGLFRRATRDVALRGRTIREGDKVWLLFAAANRDPERFPDPDRFDPARTPNDHLGFGGGIHYCLGSMMARLEARLAFGLLLERFPGLHVRPEEGCRSRHPVMRGFHRLPSTL